ncbi:hypothetical protein [Sphingomonas lacusdianchii]|uniref:hypothetical protein n=1 Tax=Sphingomonas lacusdianchii TaxID=2917992 RepID=UPI001F55AE07|nr:hypothetical protein [Sphingomonas sp. JXJ CY 53]
MRKLLTGAIAGTCLFVLPAAAQTTPAGPVEPTMSSTDEDPGSTFSAAVAAGSLGIGPEIGWRLSDHVGIRGGANFLNVSASFEPEDVSFDGKIKLNSFGAMVDVYPFGGNFRLSGGARINNNEIGLAATPNVDVEINGNEYSPQEVGTLSTSAAPKKFSPALTFGWSGKNRRGFMVGVESGVLFQGSFKIDPLTSTGTARNDATFRADLEAERLSLQKDVDKVKVYPIFQFAIGYRF